ncbi:MAG TPA: response regulator [Candidatus Thermoplasmatota archaeon]|nr:response regulator [Candidatus Thermoplasmatota archaeon]
MRAPGRPIRLLLVEDNPRDARLVEIALSEAPQLRHELRRASSLAEAKASVGSADLVLLDLGLPESQGIPTLRALLPAAGATPIVVLSGRSDPESELDALGAGARGYVPKSHLTAATLAQHIEAALA